MIAILGIFSLGKLLYAAGGFIAGALVFRNNPKDGEKIVADLKAKIKELEAKVK